MANIKSAQKRIRQDKKRTARNRVRRERLRKAIKSFRATVETGDESKIKEGLQTVQKAVDKACVKGILHKNAADRNKSRLHKAAQKALAAK